MKLKTSRGFYKNVGRFLFLLREAKDTCQYICFVLMAYWMVAFSLMSSEDAPKSNSIFPSWLLKHCWVLHRLMLTYFTLGFLFFTLNVVFIGFYQSIEQAKRATLWMMLRGVIFVIPSFILLPMMLGDKGLWLAVPLSEMLTFVVILLSLVRDRMKNGLL